MVHLATNEDQVCDRKTDLRDHNVEVNKALASLTKNLLAKLRIRVNTILGFFCCSNLEFHRINSDKSHKDHANVAADDPNFRKHRRCTDDANANEYLEHIKRCLKSANIAYSRSFAPIDRLLYLYAQVVTVIID